MKAVIIFLAVTILLLLTTAVMLYTKNRHIKRDTRNLCYEIDKYLQNGKQTELYLEDNDFAKLQNRIKSLEENISLMQIKLSKKSQENLKFVSDISHQLKTPLAALKLYCEMDMERNIGHSEKEYELIEKTEQLVFHLLKLEKIQSDLYELNFASCNALEPINAVLKEYAPLFPHKRITVTGSGNLRCDKEWMTEAVGNIIKNSCEHTANDGIINIEIRSDNTSTDYIISDNGGGMSAGDISNMFVRFHKSSNSAPTNTGIGMSITKAIVEKHHGTISVENAENGLKTIISIPNIDCRKII